MAGVLADTLRTDVAVATGASPGMVYIVVDNKSHLSLDRAIPHALECDRCLFILAAIWNVKNGSLEVGASAPATDGQREVGASPPEKCPWPLRRRRRRRRRRQTAMVQG